MNYSITPEEKEIMRQAYVFLRDHLPVPKQTSKEDSELYWSRMCDDLIRFGKLWNNHPLALQVMPALFDYLEEKWKEEIP